MKLTKLEYDCFCEKVDFSVIHPTHITIYSFEEQCVAQKFCKLSGKVTF